MHIGFVTDIDITNPNHRSGVPYFLSKGLKENGCSVTPINIRSNKRSLISKLFTRLIAIWYNFILSKKPGYYIATFTRIIAKAQSKQLQTYLNKNPHFDFLLSLTTTPFAYLNTTIPKLLWIDHTFETYASYSSFNRLPAFIYREAHQTDSLAYQNAGLIVAATPWAAASLSNFYKVHGSKVMVLPRGANLFKDTYRDEIKKIIQHKHSDTCELLFIGADWHRKGGPFLIETADYLHRAGVPYKLHLVGDIPNHISGPNIRNYGFLNKSVAEEYEQLINLYKKAYFLVVPTRSDAFGIVFAEASAYGVPSIAPAIDGVKFAVQDGVNGYLFNPEAGPEEVGNIIINTFYDQHRYQNLSIKAYDFYEQHFQWYKLAGRLLESFRKLNS